MNVREAKLEDARKIHEMHMLSIRENCADSYTEREINAWAGRAYNQTIRESSIIKDHVLVLDDGGNIYGYSHLSADGELKALYLHPDVIHKGCGRTLLSMVEDKAMSLNFAKIYLDSTLNAVNFYRSHGYEIVEAEKRILINNEEIRCVRMKKKLTKES